MKILLLLLLLTFFSLPALAFEKDCAWSIPPGNEGVALVYFVQLSDNNGPWYDVGTTEELGYLHTNLQTNTEYRFRVRCDYKINPSNIIKWSDPSTIYVGKPSQIKVVRIGNE